MKGENKGVAYHETGSGERRKNIRQVWRENGEEALA